MKKQLLTYLLILSSHVFLAQTQIGSDIDGGYVSENGVSLGDSFGWVVSMSADGSTIAGTSIIYNGGFGYVKVYRYANGSYTQLGSTLFGTTDTNTFGSSISLSGDGTILAIGDNAYGNIGRVSIYKFIAGDWVLYGNPIVGGNVNDGLGYKISLSEDGNRLAVSLPGNSTNGANSGQVRIYTYFTGNWIEIGDRINGQNAGDGIGYLSMSADGNSLAIGTDRSDVNGTDSGTVRIFRFSSGFWSQVGSGIYGTNTNSRFGFSLSLSSDGNTVAISDYLKNQVKVYRKVLNNWSQLGATITGENAGDFFGYSISLSNDALILAVGAITNSGNGNESGSVRIYKNIAGTWTKIGLDIDGEAAGDNFGQSVYLNSSGSKLVVGAPHNNNLDTSGQIRVFDLIGILSSDSFILDNFNIYPNPVSEVLTISLQKDIELQKANIYNQLGQLIKTETTKNVNVASLAKGNYYLEVITDKGKATKTIIVK